MHLNEPISEQYRVAAMAWVDQDAAARLLEETKSAFLSTRMKALGDIPASHAEREVKSSPAWEDFIAKMVNQRTGANKAKVQVEYLKMKAIEHQSFAATKRAEMRL